MLAHGVKCALTGGGTGNLTIGAAASGFRTPTAAFLANVPFYGTIYEGALDAPTKWEAGWFSHNGSGSLVRHLRDCTYNGTTFDDTSPAAVNFGSSANLICTQPPRGVLPTRFLSGNTLFSGNDFGTSGDNFSYTNTNVTANTTLAYITPVLFETGFTLAQMGLNIGTAGAASTICRMALVAPDATDGDPGTIIAVANAVPTDVTGMSFQSVSASIYVPAGWYWVIMGCTGAPSLRGTQNQSRTSTGVGTFGSGVGCYTRNHVGLNDFVVGDDWWNGQGTGAVGVLANCPTPHFK